MHVHLVFVTKYRRGVLSELATGDLTKIFAKVCRDFGAELKECSSEDDHVHLPVVYAPKLTVSKHLDGLEGVSSRLLRARRPKITGRYEDGRPVVALVFRRLMWRRTARAYYRVHPQPTRGRASSPPPTTGFPTRKLR